MRRLPIYLLLDTSGSMFGEPIESVKNGVHLLLSELRQDPYALETAFISIITFSDNAQQIIPLTELSAIHEPEISAGGCTALGEALELLANKIKHEVTKTTHEKKGDWKPLVFLMTDGAPTDNIDKGINAIKKCKFGVFVSCAAGHGADLNLLQQISSTVVQLDTADSATIKAFFKWISSSISTGSQKVGDSGNELDGDTLPPPPGEINVIC